MFLKLNRSKEKPVPVPSEAGISEFGNEEAAEQKVHKIESLEELVARRTQSLKEAQAQLSHLVVEDSPETGKENKDEVKVEDLFTQPNPPGAPAKEEIAVKEEDLKAILKVDVISVGEKEAIAAPGVEKAEAGKKPEVKTKAKDDSLADLFDQEEEKDNPLDRLIQSLPDVSARELLNEAKEVSTIIKGWRRH